MPFHRQLTYNPDLLTQYEAFSDAKLDVAQQLTASGLAGRLVRNGTSDLYLPIVTRDICYAATPNKNPCDPRRTINGWNLKLALESSKDNGVGWTFQTLFFKPEGADPIAIVSGLDTEEVTTFMACLEKMETGRKELFPALNENLRNFPPLPL